jgi:hypothetical protein
VAVRRFELTTTVRVRPETAIDFLMRLDAHRGMHPYLRGAEVTASGVDGATPWWAWRVTERPALGPVRYTIRFSARMSRVAPGSMTGSVRAAPGCMLDTVTSASTSPDGTTIVQEITTVTAPSPLVRYMAKHAEIAHARTFSLLDHELGASAR